MTAYLAMSLILYAISRLVHVTRGITHIAFMSPLSVVTHGIEVWIYFMTTYLAVSLILYVISRLVCITHGMTHVA